MIFGTVLWTMVCAIFGAACGFILGSIIELFAGGAGLAAPLTAIGFILGAAFGILASLLMFMAWRGAHARRIHDWAHGFGHSFRHYRRWTRWNHYWWDGCAGEYEAYSAEDALRELDSYLSYLEDMPGEKLAPCEDKLGRLSERLDRLRAARHP